VFGGRFQKMDSLLAAAATAFFNTQLSFHLPEKAGSMPIFDCRSFVVPNLLEAYHCFLWRQQDCRKNAISMTAQAHFSHKTLQGLNGPQMIQRLKDEYDLDFDTMPACFRLGTFARRLKVLKTLPLETVEKLKAIDRDFDPTMTVERSEVQTMSVNIRDLENPVEHLFKGSPPSFRADAGSVRDEG
jgi:tRNA(His) 5'-end guanylyltransferase